MGCKPKAPKAPDNSGLIDALTDSAGMANEQAGALLDFQKQQWAEQKAMQREIMDVQLPAMRNQAEWAIEDRQRYEDVFLPMQDQMIAEAKRWSSPEKQELEAGKAQADVTKAFENQRQNSLRKLEGMGIDPSQTRALALDKQTRAAAAAVQAAAGNNARRYVEERGMQLQAAATGLGSALPTQAMQANQGAANIGSQIIGDRNGMINANMGIANAATGAINAGVNASSAAGNLMNSGYQNQLAGWQANTDQGNSTMSALGSMAGIAAMMSEGGHVGNVVNQQGIPVNDGSGGEVDNVPVALN